MIREIVKQWDERKGELAKWLAYNHPASYQDLLTQLVTLVLHGDVKYGRRLNETAIHRIDDGHYQGTEIFLIPLETYQPDADDYVWLDNSYGSCSGCDTLQSISGYSGNPPTVSQIEAYMTLALHMVQRMAWLENRTEVENLAREVMAAEEKMAKLEAEKVALEQMVAELEVTQALDGI